MNRILMKIIENTRLSWKHTNAHFIMKSSKDVYFCSTSTQNAHFIAESTTSVHLNAQNAHFLRKSINFVNSVHSVGCDGQSLPWTGALSGIGSGTGSDWRPPQKQIIYNLSQGMCFGGVISRRAGVASVAHSSFQYMFVSSLLAISHK